MKSGNRRFRTGRRMIDQTIQSGEKFNAEAYEAGVITGDPNRTENPTSPKRMFIFASGACVGVLAFSYILSMISPQPEQGQSDLMQTQDGGLYILYAKEQGGKKELHPVMNLASARLIAGKPDKPTIVKAESLKDYPRGSLMGIPGAPGSLLAWDEKEPSSWGICDFRDSLANLTLTQMKQHKTVLVGGKESWEGGTELSGNKAIVARSDDDYSKIYLIWGNKRSEISDTDTQTLAALGITSAHITGAVSLSQHLINALEPTPTLTVPNIPRRGFDSATVSQRKNGDILSTIDVSGNRAYFVVLDDGIQKVPALVAQLFTNSGGNPYTMDNSEAVSNLPQKEAINLANYPSEAPEIITPNTTCWQWSRNTGDIASSTRVLYGNRLPVKDEALKTATDVMPPKDLRLPHADQIIIPSGKGWYGRTTGNDEASDEASQIFYVSDGGVRYNVIPADNGDYADTLKALGFGGVPTPIPDRVARLFSRGVDLNRAEALKTYVTVGDGAASTGGSSTESPETNVEAPSTTVSPTSTKTESSTTTTTTTSTTKTE